ncbi:MAG TPA: hypothetical protein VHG52_04910, partial [Thermomicrobiales bacterium]|nr:hypothetical protein [Thermomicrobiales bacterium]
MAFPLTPLNGVVAPDERYSPTIGMDRYVIFEKEIMSPTRKERITNTGLTPTASRNGHTLLQNPLVQATTPQGMLVEVDGADWQKLTLAYDEIQYLRFGNITDEFQDALQSNRLFLVASEDATLAADGDYTEDTVEIADWPFKLEVGKTPFGLTPPSDGLGRMNNVVIFKFVDETFENLIADTRVWANPTAFNSDVADVQTWLQEMIEDAKAKAADPETEALYSPLVNNVLTNPNWTGILSFNVSIPVGKLPCEVQGLLGGIRKLAEFKAHHLGFEIAKVNNQGTDIEKSSMFALIDYEDNDGPATTDPPLTYEFIVKSLKVRFANSEIADFASTISIKMKRAFDEAIRDPGGNPELVWLDTLELEGSYQDLNGTPSYTFELVAVNNPFRFGSTDGSMSLIDQMTVTKVQFGTDECIEADPIPDGATISAKFSYWGFLKFRSSAVFDFFSFDKLVFYGLNLKMTFGFNADGTPKAPDPTAGWHFDPSGMNISVSVSESRGNSLLANFPLRVNSFHYAPGGIDISNLGFLEIPNLVPGWGAATSEDKPMYALSYTIDLGPLSSMTSKKVPTGAIEIISAWFTEDEGSGVLFGLKLGAGSDGTKEFGIQGVLTLAVDHFGFLKIPENPGPNQDWMYAFFIKSAFLKIVNTQIPPGGDFSLMLFIPYSGESGKVNLDNLGWFVAYNNTGGSVTGGGNGAPHQLDAQITSVNATPSTFAAGGSTTINVVVKNIGTATIPLEITVKAEVKPTGDTTHRPL